MDRINIYTDESGDLGWVLDKPYRGGGSSKYLTIASLAVNPSKKHIPKQIIRKLYKKFKWSTKNEKKWVDMKPTARLEFANLALDLTMRFPDDINYLAITVKKQNVQAHIRSDPNKLYNYMISCSLLDLMSTHEDVVFIPDPRTIKVASGNSLHDYLGMKLWFDKGATTQLSTKPADSASNRNIQFTDMLCGMVQSHFEDGNSDPWDILQGAIECKRLYFNP